MMRERPISLLGEAHLNVPFSPTDNWTALAIGFGLLGLASLAGAD